MFTRATTAASSSARVAHETRGVSLKSCGTLRRSPHSAGRSTTRALPSRAAWRSRPERPRRDGRRRGPRQAPEGAAAIRPGCGPPRARRKRRRSQCNRTSPCPPRRGHGAALPTTRAARLVVRGAPDATLVIARMTSPTVRRPGTRLFPPEDSGGGGTRIIFHQNRGSAIRNPIPRQYSIGGNVEFGQHPHL